MNMQKRIIFSIATAISLCTSTAVLADDVQSVLDIKIDTNTEHSSNNILLERVKSPRTIQDHVNNYLLDYQQRHDSNANDFAAMKKPVESGWRQSLGNPAKI